MEEEEFDFTDIVETPNQESTYSAFKDVQTPLVRSGINLAEGVLKSGYSFLTDELPKSLAQADEVRKSALQPSNIDEYIKGRKSIDFQRFVRQKDPKYSGFTGYFTPFDIDEALPKYGKQFMEEKGLGKEVDKMDARLPEVIERRKELEVYVNQQKQEAATKLKGVVTDYRDIESVDDFASYIGSLAGQAIGQIPLAVATRGSSSFLLEAATIYDKQLDRLADENKITRQEVIEKNLDSPALGQTYALLAAGLDASSAGNILGAFRKQGGSLLKKFVLKTAPESLTEPGQGFLEDIGAGGTVEDALTGEGLAARINEFAGGIVGSSVFSFVGKSDIKDVADKAINQTTDAGSQVNSIIDAEATLTPQEENILKTKIAEEQLQVVTEQEEKLTSDIANKTEETVQNNEQTGAKPEALNEGKTINQINNENEKGQEKEVLTFDQTPEYQQADQKIRELAETVRQEPSAENARLLNEAIQERDNARIAFEQKKARQPKQEKSVQLTPAQATEAQIKILDRGIRLGRDITQKEVISQVRNAAKEANLSPQQIRVLANKAGKVSLSPESINNFNTFVDKVVNDAKFAEKVSKANKAVKVIKKQLPKATNKERAALKVFTALDPETDIDQYVSIADDVRRSLLPKRNKNYKPLQLTPVNQFIDQVTSDLYKKEFNREPNNLTPEQRYNEIQESQFNKRNQARVDKLAQDLGLTLEEQQLLLENKPFETSNKERVRSEFVNMAKVAKSKLNTVPSNADVEAIKQIDPDQLDIEDLKEYIEVVDRIYENNDFGNVATMVAEGKAQKAINDIGSRIKSKILNLLSFETSTASLPQAFQAIYGLAEDASYVQLKLGIKGIEDAHAAKVQAGFTFADSMNKMKEKFEKLYGKQKSGFTEDSIARQAIYRTLIKHDAAVDGDSYMRDKGKKAIETTIKTYRTKKQDEVADRLEKLYKPFVNAQSIADVEAIMKNIDPAGKRVFEFIVDTYSQYSDRVKRYNERNYNSFSQDIVNYAGETNVYKLDKSGNTIEPERVKRGSFKPKRLDSSKRFTGEVPEGSVIDLDFHVGVTRHIEELVFKLESEDSMLLVNQILKKKEKVLEILGSNQDPDKAEKIYEYIFDKQNGIYKSYLDSSFGVGMSRDPSESFVSNLLTIAHKAVYTATLSGPTQYIKQLTPLVSTAVNLGTDVDLLFDSRSQISKDKEGFNKWISTETVSTRGKEGSVIGLGDMLNSSKILQTENNLKKALFKDFASYIDNQFRNNLFVGLKGLLKGDSTAAETSFFAFYKEYLRNKGKIEFKSFEQEIALKDTDLRQEALAYAKQMVDNAQVVSNPAALSKVSKTRTVSGKLVKAQLLPFGSFTLSKGQRLQNDLKSLISGTSKQRARAAQDMTAVAAESIVFAGLKLGLKATWGAAWVAVLRELFNLDDPQDDEEKRKAKAAESSRYITEVITDNIPTVLLSSEPVRNAFIDGVEQVAYWWYKTENPDITKKEFEDETGISLRNRKNTGVADYLGSYGIIGDNLASFYKHVEDATNEELPVNKRALAAFTGLITFAGTVGLAPADIRFPIESENRKQLKQEKNANPTSEGGVPRRADKLPPLPKLPPRRTKLPQRPKLLPPKQ